MIFVVARYTSAVKRWRGRGTHYLGNPPPGCLFCVAALDGWQIAGVLLVGRPVARMLPQDGSWGEITRMYLVAGLPHGTASAMIRFAIDHARTRSMVKLISYHDRTRHTGCIYRKAGMRKFGKTTPPSGQGWGSRVRPKATQSQDTPKQRWGIDL